MSVTVRVLCSPLEHEEGRSSSQSGRANGLTLKGRTAQIVNGKLMLVEAPHSRNGDEIEVAHDTQEALNEPSYASQSPLNEAEEDAPTASTSRLSTPMSSSKARPKAIRRQTRYFCTWGGCCKSYAKPVRLAEHMRSHTGERPFECTHEGCNASYLRDTHLVAHMRTHLDEKDKPFTCEEDECGKKFWTNQHLNRHVKLVHEQDDGAYKCEECDAAFNKHNKLREHVAKDHMPEGTKPFICPEEGCGKSFRTGSKLRTHSKVHDENRYVCMHPSHLGQAPSTSAVQNHPDSADNASNEEEEEEESSGNNGASFFPKFATWSALQEHNKLEHPPTCPHPECGGRIFKSGKKLRKHCIKVHLDTIQQSEEETATGDDADPDVPVDNENAEDDAGPSQVTHRGSLVPETATAQTISPSLRSEEASVEEDNTGSSAPHDYAFGGRARKRKNPTPIPQLIPTQPVAFQSFDGTDDYVENAEDASASASKRVRFL